MMSSKGRRGSLPHHKQGGRQHQASPHLRQSMGCLFWPLLLFGVYFIFPNKMLLASPATAGYSSRQLAETALPVKELTATVGAQPYNDAVLSEDKDTLAGGRVVSRLVVQVAPSGSGLLNKYYYRFKDAVISKEKITVYYGPDFLPPTREHWVDFISGNTSSPDPPTMLVIKGDLHSEKWYYLPIEYLPALSHQPTCKTWVDKSAYLLQVRYSYNIWHTWNEGLMGIFQTLREHGDLPLVSIDDDGNMDEITQGMGGGCPWEYDFGLQKAVQPQHCGKRSGVVDRNTCNPATEAWCRPGVMSYRRSGTGPIIVPYTAASVMNVWAHLYSAMTTDVRDWSIINGACFRDLTIGKTSTLNFYQAVNQTGHQPGHVSLDSKFAWTDNMEGRVEAMAVFKGFVHSAQKEWFANERARNPAAKPWLGYRDAGMERLRRGVGPEDMDALDAIVPKEVPGMLREEMDELQHLAAEKVAAIKPAVDAFVEAFGGAKVALEAAEKAKQQGANKTSSSAGEDADDATIGVLQRHGRHKKRRFEDDEAEAAAFNVKMEGNGVGKASQVEKTGLQLAAIQRQDAAGNGDTALGVGILHRIRALLAVKRRSKSGNTVGRTLIQSGRTAKPFFSKALAYRHEAPRPVVTYASRNFFSRGVLNERDILEYILSRYNVTLRVTTFEEPLLEVMDTLGGSDVFLGMHGAGWTNGLFMKRGATTLQMFPYGWRLPNGATVRGYNYREIVLASECPYLEWVNPRSEHAFFRRIDYTKKWNMTYALHPSHDEPLPSNSWPGNPWIYQNTYVDMNEFGGVLDQVMAGAGIEPMR